jgi:hypothetical protein
MPKNRNKNYGNNHRNYGNQNDDHYDKEIEDEVNDRFADTEEDDDESSEIAQTPQRKTKDDKEKIIKQTGALSYNDGGHIPVGHIWHFTPDYVKKEALKHCQNEIRDFKEVTLYFDRNTGRISVCAWLPWNSEHLIDKSVDRDHDVKLGSKYIKRQSEDLRQFMNRYCRNEQRRIGDDEGNSRLKGIEIDVSKILHVMIDGSGQQYRNAFDKTYNTNAKVEYCPMCEESNDKRYGKLVFIEVTKKVKSAINREPKLKRSFNIHD